MNLTNRLRTAAVAGLATFTLGAPRKADALMQVPCFDIILHYKEGPNNDQTYTVQKGDNLTTIAGTFYLDGNTQRIAEANHLENPDLIFPGQVLTIPMQRKRRYLGVDNSGLTTPKHDLCARPDALRIRDIVHPYSP